MNKIGFECGLWNNGGDGWGIRVGRYNARQYFSGLYPDISIQFQGQLLKVALDRGTGSSTFWNSCPEFRHPEIRRWVHRNAVTLLNKRSIRFEMREIERFRRFEIEPIVHNSH